MSELQAESGKSLSDLVALYIGQVSRVTDKREGGVTHIFSLLLATISRNCATLVVHPKSGLPLITKKLFLSKRVDRHLRPFFT